MMSITVPLRSANGEQVGTATKKKQFVAEQERYGTYLFYFADI
jgi:hypothetical protein